MILSHKHRFIYIKTLKTAGTSLEIALSKFCGPEDVITKIDAEDEKTRRALGFRGAQGFRPRLTHLMADIRQSTRTGRDLVRFFNHMPATMVRDRVSEAVWNGYFKFTTTRDPLDQAISLYYWRKRMDPGLRDMAHFLRRYGGQLYRNTEIVSEAGQFLLDDVARYETLPEDLDRIGARIGIEESLWDVFKGINAKGGVRAKRAETGALVGPAEREMIRYICAAEYGFYGYE